MDMARHHYIPLMGEGMTTYLFRVELEKEDDGRWSAWIEALPGCAAWGYTKEEALKAIQDATEAYVEDMLEAGEEVPIREGITVVDAPVVTVTRGV
jgi:predicted RNase H-like HicB family nuclease